MTARVRELLPGVMLALGLALAAQWLAGWVGANLMGLSRSPVSPIMMAILLGMLLRNAWRLPPWTDAGVRFCLVRVLRLGIVLLGIRLSLSEAGAIGLRALPVIIACVITALVLVSQVSRRVGLTTRMGTLIAAGTGICGATAIVALSPVIRARDEETAYAVACITLFGVAAMLAYPFVAHWLFEADAFRIGLFLGTSVHETAQVAGAGLVYQEYFGSAAALDIATVTKLVRNLLMLAVIPALGFAFHRTERGSVIGATRWYAMVPLFVLGFAAMSLLRTLGDMGDEAFGVFTPSQWTAAVTATRDAAELCLGVAMAAVGLGTSFRGLRQIGMKPFGVGLLSALLVGVVSWGMITTLH